MRTKILLLAIAALISTVSANAQLLWKVTPAGSDKVSYLFGTHHLSPLSVLDKTPGFNEALNSVEKVYGEIDMLELMSSPEKMMVLQNAMKAPADSTLSRVLTPAELDSVANVISIYFGPMLSVEQLEGMKPVAVSTTLANVMSQRALEAPLEGQLDSEILARAKKAGKEMGGLETVEYQVDILFNTPLKTQAADLMYSVRMHEEFLDVTKKLITLYQEADLEGLTKLMSDPTAGMNNEEANKLIYNRNNNWVKQLEVIMPGKSVLVAVGAGHLGGEDGLINLLREKGFKVEPVTAAEK